MKTHEKDIEELEEIFERDVWNSPGLGGTLLVGCDKVGLILKYFDYIARFVDTILLYMYVFCFDICKLF